MNMVNEELNLKHEMRDLLKKQKHLKYEMVLDYNLTQMEEFLQELKEDFVNDLKTTQEDLNNVNEQLKNIQKIKVYINNLYQI